MWNLLRILAEGYGCDAYGSGDYGECVRGSGGSLVNTGMAIWLAIAIAALLIFIAVFVMFLKRKKDEDEEEPPVQRHS